MTPVLPTGRQYEIAHGPHRAVAVEVGGGLRTYEVGGVAVLDGYGEDELCDGARGLPLVPWPNRIKDGAYDWDGQSQTLALTEPAQHNALHGLLRHVAWEVVSHDDASLVLTAMVWPQTGYPFAVRATVAYALGDDGLTVRTTGENVGVAPAPWAAGAHPYLTVGTPTIDEMVLHLPVETWLPTGPQQEPVGEEPVAGSPYDFRTPRPLGDVQIDYAFGGLARQGDGRAVVRVSTPAGNRGVDFWLDEAFPYVEVFTGDTLPAPGRRRRGLGLEPMTAPPNAFQTGTGVVRLAPGASHAAAWGMRPW